MMYTKRMYIPAPAAVVPSLYFTHGLGGSTGACGERQLVMLKCVEPSYVLSRMGVGFLRCSVPDGERNVK